MQKIPVTRDGKRGSEVIVLDSSDVVRIDNIRDRVYIIHTKDEQFYLDISFDSIEEWLFEDGFRMLDSTNIVNMHHVTEYDANKGIVYLGDRRSKATKTASAARIQRKHIENVIQMLKIAKREEKRGIDDENRDYDDWMRSIAATESDEKFLRSYITILAETERKRSEAKIVHMAYHDALTNLPNRLLFHERLNQAFADAESSGKMLAVIFLDLDRFKVINDTLGHHVGDELLKHFGKRLQSYVREEDTVARFSGDEFIILMTGIAHIDEVTEFVKGIPSLLYEPFVWEGHELFVTCSIGLSLYPQDGLDASTLIKNADTAMYRAKIEKGGNTFAIYRADMNQRSMERLNLEIDLRRALKKNEFTIYYQPLVNLRTGRILGMESLVRWVHPQKGMISPSDFIPLAEETGLIVPIGNWVLQEACRQNKAWHQMGFDSLCVSVNISASQFQQPGFVQFVKQTLEETGLEPGMLCLEITENVAMKNVAYIVDTMNKLKELGVRISIDDFGTGYSSLSYLKRFKVHTLKIDQSFIQDLTHDEDNAAIVSALIMMSQRLKIKSLAEGVETKEQLDFLRQHGCDEIQGYIFSKPLAAADFENLLKENDLHSEM